MQLPTPVSQTAALLQACTFDVDGVLLASPHERAWREALQGFANPARFTTSIYQANVAGRPRLDGALAALEALGVDDAAGKARAYADRKQQVLLELVRSRGVAAFPDALRFVDALAALRMPLAVASSSKNANDMMRTIRLPSGLGLLDVFRVNVCGRDVAHGKPDPELYSIAASELGIAALHCCVVEDAPAGIEAARAGHMPSLGVARLADAAGLLAAGANLVVTTLDDVGVGAFAQGRLERRSA
jgi:beta-phosphoglucomutase